jgi:hypothetical protein
LVKTRVAYPFGFGLSYTTFRYSNLKIAAAPGAGGARAALYDVSFDLTHTGRRPAADVARLYVTPAPSKLPAEPGTDVQADTNVAPIRRSSAVMRGLTAVGKKPRPSGVLSPSTASAEPS